MGLEAQITFRTDDDAKNEMAKLAKNMGKKPSQLMNEILHEYLRKQRENQASELDVIKQMFYQHEQEIIQLKQQHVELAKKLPA